MNRFILFLFLGLGHLFYAQIAVMHENPEATLDVLSQGKEGKTKSFIARDSDGIEKMCLLDNGRLGINISNPSEKLDVSGNVKIERDPFDPDKTGNLIVEGELILSGRKGIDGEVLVSDAQGKVSWMPSNLLPGYIAASYSRKGTYEAIIPKTTLTSVPGLSFTHTVPKGKKQTVIITFVGSARYDAYTDYSPTGIFVITSNGVKIGEIFAQRGYNSITTNTVTYSVSQELKVDNNNDITYTFDVLYYPLYYSAVVNYSSVTAYPEATKSSLQAIVYNN